MAWLNRIGLILNFVSFWLAAPEILGEERLKTLYRTGLKSVPFIAGFFIFYLYILLIGLPVIYIIQHFKDTNVAKYTLLAGFILMFVGLPLSGYLRNRIDRWLQSSLFLELVDNYLLRRRLLFLGGIFFVTGFVLQFVATF